MCRLESPTSRSAHELRGGGGIYESLPKSLVEQKAMVRARMEEPEVQRERAELTRSKTPSELAQIRGIRDIPIPGLWADHGTAKTAAKLRRKSSEAEDATAKPRTSMYNTLPNALLRPCVVRSVVSDFSLT